MGKESHFRTREQPFRWLLSGFSSKVEWLVVVERISSRGRLRRLTQDTQIRVVEKESRKGRRVTREINVGHGTQPPATPLSCLSLAKSSKIALHLAVPRARLECLSKNLFQNDI